MRNWVANLRNYVFACALLSLLLAALPSFAQPCQPVRAGGDGGVPLGVVVQGNTAYLNRGEGGIQIIDVSDSSNPTRIGYVPLGSPAREVILKNERLYIFAEFGLLHIFDVSVPTEPRRLGAPIEGSFHGGFVVGGGVSFFAHHRDGLLNIVDTRDPSKPIDRGHLPSSMGGQKVSFVAPGISMVSTARSIRGEPTIHKVWTIDHSDPSDMRLLGSMDIPFFVSKMSVHLQTAYVASLFGLRTFDLSDPANPLPLGVFDEFGVQDFMWRPGVAFVLTSRQTLAVLNTSDPSDMSVLAEIDLASLGNAIVVDSGRAFVAADSGLYIFDVRDQTNPRLVGQLHEFTHGVGRMIKIGNTIVAAGGDPDTSDTTVVLNISDPLRPEVIPTYDVFLGGGDIASIGNIVVATGSSIFNEARVVDVSQPSSPRLRSRLQLPGPSSRVTSDAGLMYVSTGPYFDHPGGVSIYDLSDPAQPRLTGTIESGFTDDIAVDDGLLLALDAFNDRVHIFDVHDPATVIELGRVIFDGYASSMAYADGFLFLTKFFLDEPDRLDVYDVRSPASARLLSSSPLPPGNSSGDTVVKDGLAYIANGIGGLAVLDVSLPTSPRTIGTFDTAGRPAGILVEGTKVYVGEGRGGLRIFDLSSCRPCPADLDADGVLTVLDFLTFQNAFDASEATADLDSDGELTIFDFLVFQTLFGAGCG